MLWLCICFPRLPFEALSLNETGTIVVTTLHSQARRIVLGSKAAEKRHLKAGMDYAIAATLYADLQPIDRNLRAERRALERLASWAYQWSSFVTLQLADPQCLSNPSVIWVEIAGSFKLFGGRAALLKQLETELAALKYEYQLGIACSLEGAALLARANRRIIADSPAALQRQITRLPVTLLALPETVVCELHRAGIRTIGTFIEQPKAAIARRFGQKVNSYLDQLLGHAADPRPAFQLPKKYRARCEFGYEVTSTEALLFPLRRLLSELQGYLRAIDSGLQRFTLHLKHRQGTTRITIGLSTPERSAERFFLLVRERLERCVLKDPVIAAGLQADQLTATTARQKELFTSAQQTTEEFAHTLDKLAARLGDNVVQSLKLQADHRPEQAWTFCEPGALFETNSSTTPRPLWLLSEPQPINAPAVLHECERIQSGWWDDDDVNRDYYFVTTAQGGCWVFRDNNRNAWYLHGLCG